MIKFEKKAEPSKPGKTGAETKTADAKATKAEAPTSTNAPTKTKD